ncbi:MAG: hypothetical protein J6W45_04995 [Bacteroidales bacterium]|nr:hypothetical protein [Bacteroidales bacterium]
MRKNAITLTTLAARLERAIHCDVGMKGLNTLLYGWARKKNWNINALFWTREKRDGEPWLSLEETNSLSEYAGYDLSHD